MTLEVLNGKKFGRYDLTASLYRLLGNPVRLKILGLLQDQSMSFSELMHALAVNPKVLSNCLTKLAEFRLVTRSYPHRVYVLTPPGRRIFREQVEAVYDYFDTFARPVKEE